MQWVAMGLGLALTLVAFIGLAYRAEAKKAQEKLRDYSRVADRKNRYIKELEDALIERMDVGGVAALLNRVFQDEDSGVLPDSAPGEAQD